MSLLGAALVAALTGVPGLSEASASAPRATAAKATKAAAPNCGTQVFRKPDGTVWKCTFGDDFNGTKLDTTKWSVMTSSEFSFGKRPDCFVNSAKNVSVKNGVLTLTSRKEPSMFNCKRSGQNFRTQYSAGMVSTYKKFSQAYGRVEFRAKFPYTTANGLQTSLWLWPDGESGAVWPISGEIDVAEWYSHFPDRVVPYLHSGDILGFSKYTNNNCIVKRVQDWHTYVLTWTPKSLVISYDGTVCLNHKGGGAPFNKKYILSMFQGFGVKKNAPVGKTPTVASAQIAWVRLWK